MSSFLSWRAIPQKGTLLTTDEDFSLIGDGHFSDFLAYYKNLSILASNRKAKSKKIEVVGILPGDLVTYTSVSVPTKNRKKMIQAIPFLVEDFVIGELDEVNIGIGNNTRDGKIRVSIADKKLIQEWIDLFSKHNIFLVGIFGFPDIIDVESNEAKIILFDDQAIFKSNNYFIQTSNDNLKNMMSSISMENISLINIFCNSDEKTLLQISRKIKIEVESEGFSKVEIIKYSGNIMEGYKLFYHLNFSEKINLSKKSDIDSMAIYYEFIPHVFLAIFFLVVMQVSLNILSGVYFSKKANITIGHAKLHYQKLFRDDVIVDVRNQWEAKLRNSISMAPDKSFSFLFSVVMSELLKLKDRKINFKLQDFRFNSDSGDIKINIEIDSIDALDVLKESLKLKSIYMDIASANSDQNSIKATIVVRAS